VLQVPQLAVRIDHLLLNKPLKEAFVAAGLELRGSTAWNVPQARPPFPEV